MNKSKLRSLVLVIELILILIFGTYVAQKASQLALFKRIPLSKVPFYLPKKSICSRCNVILISIDTLRADALPCLGYFRNTAPNLCAYADKNVFFTNAYSQTPFSLDSHMSIFTSLYASFHGVKDIFKDELNPAIKTLDEVFKAKGYDTIYAGVINNANFPFEKGFGRGFNVREKSYYDEGWDKTYKRLVENVNNKKPTFIFLHTYEVHFPYLPGKLELFTQDAYPQIPVTWDDYLKFDEDLLKIVLGDFQERIKYSDTPESLKRNQEIYNKFKKAKNLEEAKAVFESLLIETFNFYQKRYFSHINLNDSGQVAYLRALYDEKIFDIDTKLVQLFSLLSDPQIAQNTIVVITADHGEEFMEHGHLGHASNVSNVQTHVPLILSVPGLKPRRIDDLVQSIDIYPTLLGLVGIEPPSWVQGLNLTDLMLGKPNALRNQYLVSEHRGKTTRAIRDMRWKLYVHDQPATDKDNELYDLLIDPAEQHNVIAQHPEIVKRLSQALEAMLKKKPSFPPVESQFPAWIDAQKRKKIIEEGYF